jgi:hypothetical protein
MQLQLSLQVIIREKREKVKEKQERKGSKKITSYITQGEQTIDEASFFCYHKCGKRDRDTLRREGKIMGRKRSF